MRGARLALGLSMTTVATASCALNSIFAPVFSARFNAPVTGVVVTDNTASANADVAVTVVQPVAATAAPPSAFPSQGPSAPPIVLPREGVDQQQLSFLGRIDEVTPTVQRGQKFTPNVDGEVTRLAVRLKVSSSQSPSVAVLVFQADGERPVLPRLGAARVSAKAIPSTLDEGWTVVNFEPPIPVRKGQGYHWVVRLDSDRANGPNQEAPVVLLGGMRESTSGGAVVTWKAKENSRPFSFENDDGMAFEPIQDGGTPSSYAYQVWIRTKDVEPAVALGLPTEGVGEVRAIVELSGPVEDLRSDLEGGVWVAQTQLSRGGGLVHGRMVHLGADGKELAHSAPILANKIKAIQFDPVRGAVWSILESSDVAKFDQEGAVVGIYQSPGCQASSLAVGGVGEVWIGLVQRRSDCLQSGGIQGFLGRLDLGGRALPLTFENSSSSEATDKPIVAVAHRGTSNSPTYVRTTNYGAGIWEHTVWRINSNLRPRSEVLWRYRNTVDGSARGLAVGEDRVWVSMPSEGRIVSIPLAPGDKPVDISVPSGFDVLSADQRGALWAGGGQEVLRIEGDRVVEKYSAHTLPGIDRVRLLAPSRVGKQVWVAGVGSNRVLGIGK